MAGEHILVVDDGKENREFVIDYVLKPAGYRATQARDGAEGLQLAREHAPDLILLDLQMPKMDGIQVLEAMRAEALNIPVILMTFYGSEEVAVDVFRLGVRDYVKKPYTVDEMLKAIDGCLAETRLRHEQDSLTKRLLDKNRELHDKVKSVTLTGAASGGLALPVIAQWREVTIMQGGLRSLGAIQPADPIAYMNRINRVLTLAAEHVTHHGGIFSAANGEGFTAIFNAPDDLPNHPLKALQAASTLQSALLQEPPNGPELGIGLDVGNARVGGLVIAGQSQYIAVGEPVVLARRLCDSATVGRALFSQGMAGRVEHDLPVARLGELTIRGKPEPIPVFSVAQGKSTP